METEETCSYGRQGMVNTHRVDQMFVALGLTAQGNFHSAVVLKGCFHLQWLHATFECVMLHRLGSGLVLRGFNRPGQAREVMEMYTGCDSMDGRFHVQAITSSVNADAESLARLAACINADLQLPCCYSVKDVIERGVADRSNCAIFVVKAVTVLGAGDKLVQAGEHACASIPELRAFEPAMASIFAAA